MWLLSQGTRVEILEPEKLRTDMKTLLQQLMERYS